MRIRTFWTPLIQKHHRIRIQRKQFVVASRKRDNANLKIAEENRVTGDKRKALNERKEALNSEIRKLSMRLDSECGQIPRQYRNGASLKKLVKILRTEKAHDLESAIKLMQ